jgi:hypothetical protein
MTSTVREQILQAILAAANDSPDPGVPVTTRSNISIEESDQLPSISFYPTREEVDSAPNNLGRFGPLITRTVYVRFAVLVAGEVPDAEADPIVGYLSKKISGNGFGGLVNDSVEHGTEWIYSETDERVVGTFVDFRIEYQTSRTDPTSTT